MRTPKVVAPALSCVEARQLIGCRMREARQNCGLSQQDIADALFCDQATISRMERGIISPDTAQIRVMSGLFQLSVLWLMGYPSFVVHATTRN
jgi:transcriptional regulator with XRE-family HTH domain